ncbi:epoxide hydrolase [Pleurocapsa sp. CCALA 161]|uniref:alpha/beta fold hydrolase n=1 Tax=Pleurocapsa sp. CCALA 161 TaxID=2107688 RepID=UPI000D08011E|nr:alpha/beta hydrolase [Pleurocapsa sp. CCALA 161]PSB11901.1 epoxide hydrolase [Pleurocapsa sp. CCALA 161]
MNNWQHKSIKTNGINLHYVSQGSGKLMLMLHGFPEFWYSWRHQIKEFASDYHTVALDLRGYNDSDKPAEQSAYQMSEFIQDIKGVITGLGYADCILVAHDWGGAIAWNFAYAYPTMVEKLIVLNIPHPAKFAQGLRTPEQLLKSWYILAFQLPFLPEFLLQLNDYQAIKEAFSGMAINKTAFSEADLNAYRDAAAKPGALRAMVNYYRNVFPLLFNNEPEWQILAVPTLTIWGEADTALGKELTYGTEAYVSNWQIKYIPHCSHWVQQEQPALVNAYIWEFLQRSSTPEL